LICFALIEEQALNDFNVQGVGPEQTVLSVDPKSRPLSWVRRQSTADLGDEAINDGMIDALAQDSW
jgi:hypothetical protein